MRHEWVGAVVMGFDDRLAKQADKTGKVTIISKVTVDVLDTYCAHCRRSYDRAKDTECWIGAVHIGGPRKQSDPIQLEIDGDDWPDPHDPLDDYPEIHP